MATTTLKDIARASGYSIKTVSRVVNRQPTVDKDIRKKVEAVIAQLNYQPNIWARALRSSRSHLIALFCVDPMIAYINQIQVSATAECQRVGYHLVVETLRQSRRNCTKFIKDMVSSIQLDGVLLPPPLSDDLGLIDALQAARVPFVRISPYKKLDVASYVRVDDRKAGYDMTQYLLKLGHRDIAFVKGPPEHGAAGERYRGFLEAMEELGGNVRQDWMVPGKFDVQSGMKAGELLLSMRKRPTAVLASNDNTAIGVMAAAYSKGFAVPRDLSIVGVDDAPIASSFWPKLTTIRQPVVELGKAATAILIREIEAPGARRIEQLEFEIVVRESAASFGGKRRQPAGRTQAGRS